MPAAVAQRSEPFHTDHPELKVLADVGTKLPERFAAVERLLATPLSAGVLTETIAFLQSPVSPGTEERERALRNGLLNSLREHTGYAEVLVPALAAQAADEAQDPGLRDYALQHLAAWVPDLDEAGRTQAFTALQDALSEQTSTYAGTALVGLNDLSRKGLISGSFDAAVEARRLALDAEASVLSRLTALALAAELKIDTAELTALATHWSQPASGVPEGARRAALNFLKLSTARN